MDNHLSQRRIGRFGAASSLGKATRFLRCRAWLVLGHRLNAKLYTKYHNWGSQHERAPRNSGPDSHSGHPNRVSEFGAIGTRIEFAPAHSENYGRKKLIVSLKIRPRDGDPGIFRLHDIGRNRGMLSWNHSE